MGSNGSSPAIILRQCPNSRAINRYGLEFLPHDRITLHQRSPAPTWRPATSRAQSRCHRGACVVALAEFGEYLTRLNQVGRVVSLGEGVIHRCKHVQSLGVPLL